MAAWGICSDVSVLDIASATRLAAQQPSLTLPAEDVSRQVVDRFFPRCEVWFDSVFLRWDKTRTVQLIPPVPDRVATQEELERDLLQTASHEGARSIDWWRQVGAAMRLSSGEVLVASNQHASHPLNAYAVGDPRSNFFKGVHFDLSTATHAEVALIGQAARRGLPTVDAVVAVTDFPCPACAKLLAVVGISTLYYQRGYAVLDGEQVLRDARVEVVHVPEFAVSLVEATTPSEESHRCSWLQP